MRWTPRRKAELLAKLDTLNPNQASKLLAFHNISPEELQEWKNYLANNGIPGLRTTRIQQYQSLSRLRSHKQTYTHLKLGKRPTPEVKPSWFKDPNSSN